MTYTPETVDLLLGPVSAAIATHLGLHYPPDRWRDLERCLQAAAHDLGDADLLEYGRALLESPWTPSRVAALAPYLTVGETYFFREPHAFDVLEAEILPGLIRARRGTGRHLRIWSAGCCTGEEAYSLAIWISRVLPDWRDWHLTILATDLNPQFLQHAAAGIYGDWSFRATPAWVKDRYFQPTQHGAYALDPALKARVTFAPLNLAGLGYPSPLTNTMDMDLIFCRNVLMYFTPERVQQVIRNLHQSLVEGGVLVVSSTELSSVLFRQFTSLSFPRITLYRKDLPAPVVPPAAAVGSPAPNPLAGRARPTAPARPVAAPASPAGLYTGAQALYARGDYARAEENLRVLVSAQIADARALALLARICANQGRLATAQEWIDQAISADELNAGYHHLRATILQEQGALVAALAGFRRTLYLDPGSVMAHFALGHLLLREGKDAEARRHFAQATALLGQYQPNDLLSESDGLTAGRLAALIAALPAAAPGPGKDGP